MIHSRTFAIWIVVAGVAIFNGASFLAKMPPTNATLSNHCGCGCPPTPGTREGTGHVSILTVL